MPVRVRPVLMCPSWVAKMLVSWSASYASRTWRQCISVVGGDDGCGHLASNIQTSEFGCLTCNQSGFQDQPCSKHPDGPLCTHHNFSKCWQEIRKPGYLRTLTLQSIWGWGVLGYRRGFWVFCGALTGSILAGLRSCGFTYGSYMCLSADCHNRHWEFWTGTNIYFASLFSTEDSWLRRQLGCKASHQVFKQNRSFSLH